MKENKSFKINVRNGLYIGDLCYALEDRVYFTIWGKQNNFEDGAYTDPETGLEFAMVGTYGGDGNYDYVSTIDGLGLDSFPVDAGIIGISDLGLCDKQPYSSFVGNLGVVLPEVVGEVEISYNNGDITVLFNNNSITIYTRVEEESDWFMNDDDWNDSTLLEK